MVQNISTKCVNNFFFNSCLTLHEIVAWETLIFVCVDWNGLKLFWGNVNEAFERFFGCYLITSDCLGY